MLLRMDAKSSRKKYYLSYTLIFAAMFFACAGVYLLLYHKSALRAVDTYDIQYVQFVYFGRWVRNGLTGGGFPVWEHAIGYGADVLLTMSSFIFDPLNWIAVITPERLAETGFLIMVIARFYLCGLSFSYLGLRRGHAPYAVLAGAVIYTFCACFYTGMYQSGFIMPMYMFPLLIAGADDLFEKNRPRLYVASLAVFAVCSFYMTYMAAILAVVYCILRWIFAENIRKDFRSAAKFFARLLGYSVLAAALAGAVLVPMALVMMDMGRLGLEPYVPLRYDGSYYYQLWRGFIGTYDMQGRDCKIGFSVIGLISVFALFASRGREKRQLKAEFILMGAALCLPFAGHVLNGFGYVSNRWVWAFALVVALIVTKMLPELRALSPRGRIVLPVCSALYILIAWLLCRAEGSAYMWLSVLLAVLSLAACFAARIPDRAYRISAVATACLTVALPAYFFYSAEYEDSFSGYVEAGTAYEGLTDSGGLPLTGLTGTADGLRFNRFGLERVRNASWLSGMGGMDFYTNIYNDAIDSFHNDVAMNTSPWTFGYDGLDRRSDLMALLGVGHFFTEDDGDILLPEGFVRREAETDKAGERIVSWGTDDPRSLFIWFDSAMSYDDFGRLSPYARQQALMKYVVTEDGDGSLGADHAEVNELRGESGHAAGLATVDELKYEITYTDPGITVSGSDIHSERDDSHLHLSFDVVTDSEIYVFFEDLDYENGPVTMGYVSACATLNGERVESTENIFSYATRRNHMYGGKKDWIVDLGLVSGSVDGVDIDLVSGGSYRMSGLHIYAEPRETIAENIAALQYFDGEVAFDNDRINLTARTDRGRYLFASIPYSDGWGAYDNGREIPVLRADTGFMAVYLAPGPHELIFRYRTPGLAAGAIATVLGTGACVIIHQLSKKRTKESSRE